MPGSATRRPCRTTSPKSELAHYLNAKEDTYDGKVWTAPWYVAALVPVLYRKDVLAKAGVAAPTTWSALLKACDALNAKGITPIAGGIKDGWFGGWLFSIIGAQGITSISDVLDATTGKAKFTDPKFAAFWTRLQELQRPQVLERRHQLARALPAGPATLRQGQSRDDRLGTAPT